MTFLFGARAEEAVGASPGKCQYNYGCDHPLFCKHLQSLGIFNYH